MAGGEATAFGDVLRHHRLAAGLTQAELAERAGLSVRGINDLERGERHRPRKDTVALLADALGLVGDDRAAFAAAGRGNPGDANLASGAPDDHPAPDLPTGTITFLFTDITGSTRLLQQLGSARYAALQAEHHRLLRAALAAHSGREVDTAGDGVFVAFPTATDALTAAAAALRALATHAWPAGTAVRVRMGLHTGSAQVTREGYVGLDVHRAARIAAAGHGGQVLLSQATRDLVEDALPNDASLRDLGAHRLKDLQRPEHLFQLVLPDLPAEFPPLNTLDHHAHNLPVQLTSFVGREREVAEITRLLAISRLVTLTGSGGCGKSRLSLRVGSELLEQYADGVWLVELAPLADPALVPQAVATTLGVREEARRPLLARLADHLHAKQLLLILDNCEHLIAACADLSDALLQSCLRLTILATSREALGLAGERPFRVPSLGLPEAGHTYTLAQVAACEAARLLVERATAAQPDFALTERNVDAVAKVCRRLDGIPLAVELAAARIRALTVEQVAERLDDCFRLLTGGSRKALPRQQTLRALIDWSHDLLTPPERLLFRRLAVFAGGWTLEAAEEVCSGEGLEREEVLDLLTLLVDKSLVLVDEHQPAARYSLLETVRQYAGEKLLESGEAAPMRDRHLTWFLALAEETHSHFGTMGQYAWASRLAAEYDNLRTALEWSRAQPSETELELRLVGAMAGAWLSLNNVSTGRAALEQALARGNPRARTSARARALAIAGQFAGMQMDLAAASALDRESVAIYRELGDKREIVIPLITSAVAAMLQGEAETAHALQVESTALAREAGMTWALATAQYLWGNAALELGEQARARVELEGSATLFRRLGDRHMAASTLHGLGRLACVEGDFMTARARVEEGLAIWREAGDRWNTAIALNSLGEVARCEGDYDSAVLLFEEALALNREISDRAGIGWSLHNLGHVALQASDARRAAMLFAESLTIRLQHEYKVGVAAGLAGMAGVAWHLGLPERAVRLYGAVEALLASIHAILPPADKLVHDGDIAAMRVQLDEAAFSKAWTQGYTMTLQEAVADALALGA